MSSTCVLSVPNVSQRQAKVIGDDWQFYFSAAGANALPFDLTGYALGATLDEPLGQTMSLAGLFDTTTLSAGTFTLTIPRATTSALLPDDTAYSIKVALTDPFNIKVTRIVVPLRVVAV